MIHDHFSYIHCYKNTKKLYESFLDAFSYLPLAAIVNSTSFCIHGGLSPLLDNIDKISRFIRRPIHTFDQNQLLTDHFWSDPFDEHNTFLENPRGKRKKISRFIHIKNFEKTISK